MKLRCVENSIRLRLRKSELEKLKMVNMLKENVQIALNSFSFGIEKSDTSMVHASFEDNCILVHIPKQEMIQWINNEEQVGIESKQLLKNGQFLSILVEKDFPCTTRPDEDKADTFQTLATKVGDKC